MAAITNGIVTRLQCESWRNNDHLACDHDDYNDVGFQNHFMYISFSFEISLPLYMANGGKVDNRKTDTDDGVYNVIAVAVAADTATNTVSPLGDLWWYWLTRFNLAYRKPCVQCQHQ